MTSEKERQRAAEYRRTHKTEKKLMSAAWFSKQRGLGFIPLNNPTPYYHAHHIDKNYVVFIPADIHLSIDHCLETPSMKDINILAFACMESSVY